jgi:4-amino-4-deoxy-L-arabinose transferase-like glycosyltransferase
VTPERARWAVLAGVVLSSVVVVSAAFNPVPHTGGDNAGYVALAHGLLTTGSYTDVFDPERLPHTKYPPLFPALLALLIALGARTWVALKAAAAIPTVVAVGLTYVWAERRGGTVAAGAVALLVAASAGFVYYSHWVLSDPLFVMLTMAALYLLERADERQDGAAPARGWLIGGVLATGLAYFTRSAGLPLVVALVAWLALRRRWRALAGSAVALAVPMLVWALRGRAEGVAQYATEFWMIDPYDPGAGTIGVLELPARLLDNLSAYVFRHGPAGVVGQGGPALTELGVVLTVAAVAGWALSARERIRPAELFFPLYAGLILLWPEVWGGDRFALPLYPLVFLYGVVALRAATARLPEVARNVAPAIALLVLLLPAASSWMDVVRQSSTCARIAGERGPWACYGVSVGHFVQAATWTAKGLPEGSAVLSRKPRHFYVLSGHPSRAFPFESAAAAHLSLADRLGARYVLLDQWDGLATRWVGAAVRDQPGAFCFVRSFGGAAEGGAQLLGILPAHARARRESEEGSSVAIGRCPAEYTATGADSAAYSSSSGRIPLLEDLDP